MVRRLMELFGRAPRKNTAIYSVEINENTLWEMSAHDALRIPIATPKIKSEPTEPGTSPQGSSEPEEDLMNPINDLELDNEQLLPAFDSLAKRRSTAASGKPAGNARRTVETGARPKLSAAASVRAGKKVTVQPRSAGASASQQPYIPQLSQPKPSMTSIEKAGALLTSSGKLIKPGKPHAVATAPTIPVVSAQVTPTRAMPKPRVVAAPQPANLSARKPTTGSGKQQSGKAPSSKRQGLVVLIEPNLKVRKALCAMLENLGIAHKGFELATEALRFMHHRRPAAVVMEASIPDMSATEVIGAIEDLYQGQPVPVVMMSEDYTILSTYEALKLRVKNYLSKPFNIHGLREVLDDHVHTSDPKTKVIYQGSIGLMVERVELRRYLHRMLVREGYALTVFTPSSIAEASKERSAQLPLSTWMVQVNDDEACADLVGHLEERYDLPVLVGMDDLDLEATDDFEKLRWKKRLLRKLSQLSNARQYQVA